MTKATVRSEFPFGVRTIEHIWIDLPDGARLSARVRLPATEHRVPAILEYVPYRKDDGTLVREWGDIVAEVRTTSTMRCDATHFHTTDSIIALENGEEIFASRRQATQTRDHV